MLRYHRGAEPRKDPPHDATKTHPIIKQPVAARLAERAAPQSQTFPRRSLVLGLGQASLVMSLVTFVAWFGRAVYMESVGPSVVAVLIVCLIVQLSILSISLFLSKRTLAES